MTELYPHWVANQSWLMFGFRGHDLHQPLIARPRALWRERLPVTGDNNRRVQPR